jgi:hypothetical protein
LAFVFLSAAASLVAFCFTLELLMLKDSNWSQYISPKLFVAALLLGFAACCWAGAWCRAICLMPDFRRFNIYTGPYSNFYPTSGEMLALANCKSANKILVIVGGDSVFNCASLPAQELWTEKLERALGDEFAVLNFSIEGEEPFEGGYLAAESLFKQGRKVVFVTDSQPGISGEPFGYLLAPLFFDFNCRGLLLDDKQREATKQACIRDQAKRHREEFIEMQRAGYLNRFVNAQDLWQAVGYKHCFTIWSYYTNPDFWRPRCTFADKAISRPWPQDDVIKLELDAIRERNQKMTLAGERCVAVDHAWDSFDFRTTYIIPQAMRARSIVVLTKYNPDLLKHLTEQERKLDQALYREGRLHWQNAGIKSLVIGENYSADDYIDANHYSIAGGRRLASELAEPIKQVAKQLGYLP